MDADADIIKLDSDNEDPVESTLNTSTVDLTSDNSVNEIVDANMPPAVAMISSANDDDIEEGEVEEAREAVEITEPASNKQTFAFEINFASEGMFKEYGHTVLNALDKALNVPVEGSVSKSVFKFSILNGAENIESSTNICIKAFIAPENEDCTVVELSDCEEAVVDIVDLPERVKSPIRYASPDLDLSSLFTIDTSGSQKLDTQCVPSYKRRIKDVLNEESSECKRRKLAEEENDCPRVRSTAACFNCGVGGHSIRECPKPRNNARINRAKLARKQERYHIDIEQRFGHLRPGMISDKLQAALGLKRGELPFFFYRMRKLGYPPGWLEEARVVHSGISLINSGGDNVMALEEENSQEDDEQKLDISKIIDFPGYNADPGPNFYDDYKHHNVPPLNRHQLKEEFIKQLGSNVIKGYKHKKLKSLPPQTNTSENKASILDSADMEIEDDIAVDRNVVFTRPPPPPEPANDTKPPPPPSPPLSETSEKPTEDSTNTIDTNERGTSPTLDDLEDRKQKLLAELKAGLCDAEVVADSPQSANVIELPPLDIISHELNTDQEPEMPITNESVSHSEPTTPTTNGSSRVLDIIKESHMGTPVLQFSPYEKLPAGENFKVGVSDVINFENLPDSTGKYEQMKEMIKKVRNIVTKLHNADDDED